MPTPIRRIAAVVVAGLLWALALPAAAADPPTRVARLGVVTGAVSFSPAGEVDWLQASLNRPLTTGDRLWTDAGARSEIQVGGATVRMGEATGVLLLNLDDPDLTQIQLSQGRLNVRVRSQAGSQVLEVDTPNLAFTLDRAGEYRIDVAADGQATTVAVRRGGGEAIGDGRSLFIDSGQAYRFTGTDLADEQVVAAPALDAVDRWAGDRDRALDRSPSAAFVSPDVVGYQDLDAGGRWVRNPDYGNVWIPRGVAADWAPYRDGHWAWVDPWGWTWVDDAPWGFAVSHYGRWAHLPQGWGWVPGPARSAAVYAPALVVFVGGDRLQVTEGSGRVGGVAWFALAPNEIYRPAYPVSRRYFDNLNRGNTSAAAGAVERAWSRPDADPVVHANRRVPGAIVAMPATRFVQALPVGRTALTVAAGAVGGAAAAPSLMPLQRSVQAAASTRAGPPPRVFDRTVLSRNAPPALHSGFEAQQERLGAQPGRPLDDAARRGLRPALAPSMPRVRVVGTPSAAPTAAATNPRLMPPAAASAAAPSTAPAGANPVAPAPRGNPALVSAVPAPSLPPAGGHAPAAASGDARPGTLAPPGASKPSPAARGRSPDPAAPDRTPAAAPPPTRPALATPAPTLNPALVIPPPRPNPALAIPAPQPAATPQPQPQPPLPPSTSNPALMPPPPPRPLQPPPASPPPPTPPVATPAPAPVIQRPAVPTQAPAPSTQPIKAAPVPAPQTPAAGHGVDRPAPAPTAPARASTASPGQGDSRPQAERQRPAGRPASVPASGSKP